MRNATAMIANVQVPENIWLVVIVTFVVVINLTRKDATVKCAFVLAQVNTQLIALVINVLNKEIANLIHRNVNARIVRM